MTRNAPEPCDLLDNLTTGIILLDAQLRVIYANPTSETLLHCSLKRMRQVHLMSLLGESQAFASALSEALHSGHPYTERERRLQLSNGQILTVDFTATPLLEPKQARTLMIELVRVDRQLRITREEQLLRQQRATRALLRGLAHEVKNPLGGVRGAAQLLERELDSPALAEYTQVIIGEADRLQKLVDRMLGPRSRPRKDWLNFHEVLSYVRNLVAAESPASVTLSTDFDPSIPELYGDRDMLVQAVLNIVRNALQAVGAAGAITLRSRVYRQYTIGNQRHKLVACIEVIDNGPGVPAELIEQIFYPMVSGHNQGSGLGLSIAQSLVNEHDGLVECESQPGHTVFTLLIPLPAQPNGSET